LLLKISFLDARLCQFDICPGERNRYLPGGLNSLLVGSDEDNTASSIPLPYETERRAKLGPEREELAWERLSRFCHIGPTY
jgi:hypothetical protein